jgi:hypothetical protein
LEGGESAAFFVALNPVVMNQPASGKLDTEPPNPGEPNCSDTALRPN